MPKIIYIEHDGTTHTCEVPNGSSVMLGAINNGVPGIDGDCGGECACGTCHVHVDPQWMSVVGESNHSEKGMLNFADGACETSRLCCQIVVNEKLDGLTVRLPAGQH